MLERHEVIAVVAAFNEGAAIGPVIEGLRSRVHAVVVVDDGSKDDTAARARAAGATVLVHGMNRGQGAALATGIRYALSRDAAVIVTFDADGQHRAEDVPAMVAPILSGAADVALGSRFLGGSAVPPLRRLVLRAATVFQRLTTGIALSDAHNGLRAFSREAARQIQIRQDRMAHASEIVAEIARLSLRYVEVPIQVVYSEYSRRKGQSALGAFRVLLDLWVGREVR